MIQLEQELERLKEMVIDMIYLVKSQTELCQTMFLEGADDHLTEILAREKTINNLDNKIDSKAEDILALHSPVAVDLRFVMASLQFNTFLERIGDNSEGIARVIDEISAKFDQKVIDELEVNELFEKNLKMLDAAIESLENEDTGLASTIFKLDEKIDAINRSALDKIDECIKKDVARSRDYLNLLIIIRKLERTGDLITNIAEENIFYLEAKVVRHKKKKIKKIIKEG